MPFPQSSDWVALSFFGTFVAATLAIIVLTTLQYWGDKRDPHVISETSGQ
jgi:hypothetical protein